MIHRRPHSATALAPAVESCNSSRDSQCRRPNPPAIDRTARLRGQDEGTVDASRHTLLVRMLVKLYRLPAGVLIAMVKAYQAVISPHMAPTCRFAPSCSQYAVEALNRYGLLKGIVLSTHRILRCHPWGGQGYDPPRWYGEPPEGTGLTETPRGK